MSSVKFINRLTHSVLFIPTGPMINISTNPNVRVSNVSSIGYTGHYPSDSPHPPRETSRESGLDMI